jgi:methionine-rich copper-binding protein CopC
MTRRLALVGLGAVLALVLEAGPAAAHVTLLSTVPADGQTVATTPGQVVLAFDQPALALGAQVVVTGPSGDVSVGPPKLVDTSVAEDLQPGAPAGRYTVAWRVTSADGHPVSGTFVFTSVAAGAGQAPAASAPPADPSRREPLIPSWGWIVAGVIVILGAVRLARRSRPS